MRDTCHVQSNRLTHLMFVRYFSSISGHLLYIVCTYCKVVHNPSHMYPTRPPLARPAIDPTPVHDDAGGQVSLRPPPHPGLAIQSTMVWYIGVSSAPRGEGGGCFWTSSHPTPRLLPALELWTADLTEYSTKCLLSSLAQTPTAATTTTKDTASYLHCRAAHTSRGSSVTGSVTCSWR